MVKLKIRTVRFTSSENTGTSSSSRSGLPGDDFPWKQTGKLALLDQVEVREKAAKHAFKVLTDLWRDLTDHEDIPGTAQLIERIREFAPVSSLCLEQAY